MSSPDNHLISQGVSPTVRQSVSQLVELVSQSAWQSVHQLLNDSLASLLTQVLLVYLPVTKLLH